MTSTSVTSSHETSKASVPWRSVLSKIDVWYASYGSNMWLPRFLCYVSGGKVNIHIAFSKHDIFRPIQLFYYTYVVLVLTDHQCLISLVDRTSVFSFHLLLICLSRVYEILVGSGWCRKLSFWKLLRSGKQIMLWRLEIK